ncbi:MAG: tripartite tricarboxylate transporter substrate-binding protein, partial [Xanthobacteraceae bacterium]
EQGYPAFTAASWVGFFAPAKTDPQILHTLNAAINDIVKSPDMAKKLSDMGFDPITGTQTQADAMFTAEVEKWGDMIKALGLSIK